jgi:ATP-dependent Lhr-like helicase
VANTFDYFHPLIKQWFLGKFTHTTDIQDRAWPLIAAHKNVLITAPTGSGKTLTAFLWFINDLVTQNRSAHEPPLILYVSPLKALNNDIKKNLDQPLAEIQDIFEEQGKPFPDIRVMTRSGDTSQADRRKMLRHPPQILITTPESLNLMLSSRSGRGMLCGLKAVILDEIHALLGNKRGVHLITAVERLVRLSGEFQRIALSATLKNLDAVSGFVGGYRMEGHGPHPRYTRRPVEKIESGIQKHYRITVQYPEKEEEPADAPVWDLLAKECLDIIEKNKATLIFTNGRRLCEKITYKINQVSTEPVAYSHHGSLSRQLRLNVEQNLKNGRLRAIVATSSLEMGIDIGELSQVILIQSPFSVSSAIQRIGRAGHHIEGVSRGTLFAAHSHDLIPAAVLAKAMDTKDIEPVHPIDCPLDVLAQIIISMTGLETWDMDELYAFLKTSRPYHALSRESYDLVLNMLAGRYSDARIRELRPRISIDRLDHTVQGKKGALQALYTSGGTIPDRGYYQLRHHDTQAGIGELDEEYVWEAKIGQIATMGTQNWKIMRITHNDVFAVPVGNSHIDAPFWIAEGMNRDFHFSGLIRTFLETAEDNLTRPEFELLLKTEYNMDETAAKELIRFLKQQQEFTGTALPHRHHLVLEYVGSGPGGSPGAMLVIHTLSGGRVNRPYAIALEAAWEDRFGEKPEIFPGNDAVVIQLPHKIEPEDILSLITASNVEALLKRKMESTGFFAARFRECASRALLLTKNKINQRMPLWMTRLKSKKLLENIIPYKDFPILLETYRTCIQDEFDLPRLKLMLDEIQTGEISWSAAFTSRPSPFAAGMAWNQINQYMYRQDEAASAASGLGGNFLRDLVFSPNLRPAVAPTLVKEFEKKRQRLAPGYAPQTPQDLLDWVKERIAIPHTEWAVLQTQMEMDKPDSIDNLRDLTQDKLTLLSPEGIECPLVVSREWDSKLMSAFYEPKEDEEAGASLLGQWLSFYGPVSLDFIRNSLGIEKSRLDDLIRTLVEDRRVIVGLLIDNGSDTDICDSDNYEILLRLSRSLARPKVDALEIDALPLFLAHYQGLTKRADHIDGLFDHLEQLSCLPLLAESWESDILPARISPYHPSFLDTLMQEGGLQWMGFARKHSAFCFKPDMDLLLHGAKESGPETRKSATANRKDPELESLFDPGGVRHDFSSLLNLLSCDSRTLSERIWNLVWQGKLSNDGFSALRKGIETGYKTPETIKPATGRRFGRRQSKAGPSFSEWRGSLPFAGYWYKPEPPSDPLDEMETEDLQKDRVRLLLDRYGILFREILHKELPQFQWAVLFRSLRLMELSGEILSGQFFKDIPGLQFLLPRAFQKLQATLPEEVVYFMNAVDPASVCGIPLPAVKQRFPKRLPTTLLVFKGHDLKLVSLGNGKDLLIHAEPGDARMAEYLACLSHLLTRPVKPLKKILVETINTVPAGKSPYLPDFKTVFDLLPESRKITLYRKPA